jgi:hypothetical protein
MPSALDPVVSTYMKKILSIRRQKLDIRRIAEVGLIGLLAAVRCAESQRRGVSRGRRKQQLRPIFFNSGRLVDEVDPNSLSLINPSYHTDINCFFATIYDGNCFVC